MRINSLNNVNDIIALTEASANAQVIRIVELGTMADVLPYERAEAIRHIFQQHGVKVRQLTNQASFKPWTEVPDFIATCMEVRCVKPSVLPITMEILMFDDTVAYYRGGPEMTLTIIEQADIAAQHKVLFDAVWESAKPLKLAGDGSTKE